MSGRSRYALTACAVLEFTALAVWVGGLVVLIAAVIPAVFNTFGGQDSGGFFLTRAFEGYNRLVELVLVVLVLSMIWRARIRYRGDRVYRVTRGEWIVLGLMAAVAGLIIFVLHPQAAARQAAAFAMPVGDARKAALAAFFQLHWPIRILYVINLGLGLLFYAIRAHAWLADDLNETIVEAGRKD